MLPQYDEASNQMLRNRLRSLRNENGYYDYEESVIWLALHLQSARVANQHDARRLYARIKDDVEHLQCDICKSHGRDYLAEHPFPVDSPDPSDGFRWLFHFHNHVNSHPKPSKKPKPHFDWEVAKLLYGLNDQGAPEYSARVPNRGQSVSRHGLPQHGTPGFSNRSDVAPKHNLRPVQTTARLAVSVPTDVNPGWQVVPTARTSIRSRSASRAPVVITNNWVPVPNSR